MNPEDHKIIGWKIWYGDDTTYSSSQGTWDSAPSENVQAVMLHEQGMDGDNRHTRVVLNGYDFYFKDGDTYGGYQLGEKERAGVKNGQWMEAVGFHKLLQIVMEDYTF